MARKKILVADDEPDFVNAMKVRLEASGHEVVTAYNGEEALRKAQDEKPDAVLLDVMMPGLDGLQVLKRLRKENKALPVYIITAFSNEERFEAAKKYNASGFIVKTDDLRKQIEDITSALGISEKYKGK